MPRVLLRREAAPVASVAKLAPAVLPAGSTVGKHAGALLAVANLVRREAAPLAKLAVTSPVAKRAAGMLAVAKLAVTSAVAKRAAAKRAAAKLVRHTAAKCVQIASLYTSMHRKKPHGAPWPSTPLVQLCAW